MNKRRAKWIAVVVSLVVVAALLVLCPLGLLYGRRLDQARAGYASPTVYITEPPSGASMLAGDRALVLVTALGATPVTRIELWSAGQLVETQASQAPEGTSPFGAVFEVAVAEGPNMLFARAVNAAGVIGQSLPVSIMGEPLAPSDIVNQITVEQGQTLEDIAASYQISTDTLHQLNPDLGNQQPAPGSSLTVPSPEREEDDQQVAPPSVGPAMPPGGSVVPMPSTPPLQPLQPSPNITVTVPLPAIIGSVLPKLLVPVFTPPAAPTDLQGYVDNCQVRLRWKDNAWDEASYDLWMAPLAGSSQRLASLQPAGGGDVWVEFTAPYPGFLSFWVEAVNSVGKQPSNVVWLQVPPTCPSTLPTQLLVQVRDMTVRGGYNKAYCYVSFENAPEIRMPGDDSQFVRVEGERGDLAAGPEAGRSIVLSIPSDGSLEMAGECWGWSGDQLRKLGLFDRSYARDTWNGARQALTSEDYEIGVTLELLGGDGTRVTYGYEDPSIPAPYNLREEKVGSEPGKWESLKTWEQWYMTRRLRWDWSGSEAVTGFTIYLDGKPYSSVYGASVRQALVTLPAAYDRHIRWQVAADVGSKQSSLSKELAYDLPKSQAYMMVKLDKINWVYTCDGCCCGDCSECEAYGWLALRIGEGEWRPLKRCASLFHSYDVQCGNWYNFSDMCASSYEDVPDALVIPFSKQATNLTFELWVWIADEDGIWSQYDKIADYHIKHTFSSFQQAQSVLGCGKQYQERNSSEDGSSSMNYTLTVFPNSCNQYPPYNPSDWGY
jgi:LysM repeat protein